MICSWCNRVVSYSNKRYTCNECSKKANSIREKLKEEYDKRQLIICDSKINSEIEESDGLDDGDRGRGDA